MRKLKWKKSVVVVCISILTGTMLMACSAEDGSKEQNKEVSTLQETESTEEVVETVGVEQEEIQTVNETGEDTVEDGNTEMAEEAIAESTEEPTPEPTPVVYEGIDMESTLPGDEWLLSFLGIIDEPKFVVFNNETNKKVIIENGCSVTWEDGDVLALYTPEGTTIEKHLGLAKTKVEIYQYYVIYPIDKERLVEDDKIAVELDTGEKISCRLVVDND